MRAHPFHACARLLLAGLFLLPALGGQGGAAEAAPDRDPRAQLGSKDWHERVEGLLALVQLDDPPAAVEAAIPLLRDEDWEVQIHAALTLGRLGGKRAQGALLDQALEGEITWVRDAALKALTAWDGAETGGRLLRRLKVQRDEELRVRTLEAIGVLAPGAVLPALRPWVRHKDERVAAAAVRAVGRIAGPHPEAHEAALALLAHPLGARAERKHFYAYAAAIEALGRMDAPRARLQLIQELLRLPDEDPYIPTRIARALAVQDPKRVRAALGDALSLVDEPKHRRRLVRLLANTGRAEFAPLVQGLRGKASDERLEAEAARAWGRLSDASFAPRVHDLLTSAPSARVRVEAVEALARLLEPAAFRALFEIVLNDKDPLVRRCYVVALNDTGDPAAIPALAAFLRDDDWRVASAAIASIGTLGIAKELPLLAVHARHSDWKIRGTAYEAMGRLRAAKAIPRLIYGLEDRDPVVRGVCLANLQILSREKIAASPKLWRNWWEAHGSKLVLRKRSRMTPEEREREEAERGKTRYAHEKYAFERKRGVEILQKARILVVLGAWDHVEVVLHHLEIPHTSLRAQELKETGLNPNQVVLVNCEGNVDKDSQERLRWFVNVGGYLMTTDWALTKTVHPCFPGYMTQYAGSTTGNDVVVVEDAAPGHPFTEGIFHRTPALMWWLEVRAFPIAVTYPEQCDVIVDSAEMRQRFGSSPMATTFRWGLGKVQHSVSHFYLQEEGMQRATKPRDRMIFAADNLGLSLAQIRALRETHGFEGRLNEATMREIAPDYSMFRLIVNVVAEKEAWVEDL